METAQYVLKQTSTFQSGCALDLLEKADVLKVENGFQKQLRERLPV